MKINLKKLREKNNLFQSDMAEILGINQSSVSRAELKGFFELTFPQMETLFERFGREEVEACKTEEFHSFASNNTNRGSGMQNNGFFGTDSEAMQVIKQQADTLSEIVKKQTELTERLMNLIEMLSNKL